MKKFEARALANQVGIVLSKNWEDSLFEQLAARKLQLGVDQLTGDWVVLKLEDRDAVVARVS